VKTKFPRAAAIAVANELQSVAGFTDRLMVVGSVRRGKADVGDVELLFIPKVVIEQEPGDMFARSAVNLAWREVDRLVKAGVLAKRLNSAGFPAWGEKNRLAVHVASGIPVDLFCVTEEMWWLSVVIRTGPKDFNLRLIDSAGQRGIKVHAYGTFEKDGQNIVPQSEQEVFEIAGLAWIEPNGR
jgi:DNA polymerase/3'-5' exonuclease PolX